MGWESQLVASHTLNEALFRFYWSLAGYGTLLWVVQGPLAWPGSLPVSPSQYILPFVASGLLPIIWEALHSSPWVFWTIYIMGSLPIDRTATLLMKFRPSYAPDLVLTMICQPRDPYVPFFWSSLSPPFMTRINGTIMSRLCLFFHRGIQLPYVV